MAVSQALGGAVGGYIFGSTTVDGPSCSDEYCGAVFKLSLGGSYLALHGFGNEAPPEDIIFNPLGAGLYGVTFGGGKNNMGSAYFLFGTKLTTIYDFFSE